MKIIILDMLINQYENREIATASLRRIDKELRNLAAVVDSGRQAVLEYFIRGNDGKPFHGLKNNIPVYKYDLTDGDRILYVHGTSLSYLNEEDRDSFVLVSYAPHDLQERVAKKGHFFHKHNYTDVKDYVQLVDENDVLNENECVGIASVFFGDFKAYVIDESELSTLTVHDLDKRVLLTQEQHGYLEEWQRDPSPTLITGGAGTGKTVMSIRMLESFDKEQSNSRAIYFTQSKELRKKGKKQLCSLLNVDANEGDDYSIETSNGNCIDFYNINDYCLQKISDSTVTYVIFHDFENEFCLKNLEVQRLCKKASLSYFDVWTDIRGVIKGSLNEFWQRRRSVSQFDYAKIPTLVEKGYLVRLENNPQQVKLPYSTREAREKIINDLSLSFEERKILGKIIDAFESIDTDTRLISLEEYLSVPDEISLFTSEQRRCVYKICELYQQWLEENKKDDENDLALKVLSQESLDKYDFIIVDEVQDYTELQLLLTYFLCDNKNAFVFAGDIHQVINPTVFNHERIKKLFLDESGLESKLKVRTLSSNYRCQQGIVDAANNLSELRRKAIGKKSAEFEEPENSHDPTVISIPFRVSFSDSNLKALLEEVMKYPRVGVLVADEVERTALVDLIGEEAYSEHPCIFTASEIKGVEYQYVVCVNVFSKYYSEWKTILSENFAKKRETKHRFYFNLIYVALTRAQLHICFIDRQPVREIDKVLNLNVQNEFDPVTCRFTDLGSSLWDWYEQAQEYRENGVYDKAIKYYQKSGECANIQDIVECQIALAENQRDYNKLIKYAILKGDLSLAMKYQEEKNVSSDIKEMISWFVSPTTKTGISQMVKKQFDDFSQEEISLLSSRIKEKLRNEARQILQTSVVAKGVDCDE